MKLQFEIRIRAKADFFQKTIETTNEFLNAIQKKFIENMNGEMISLSFSKMKRDIKNSKKRKKTGDIYRKRVKRAKNQ